MQEEIVIEAKVFGQRKHLIEDWSIEYPPEYEEGGKPLTLRDLIVRVVIESVRKFKKRQQSNKFIKALSSKAIMNGADRGKIAMGGSDLEQEVDEDVAVAVALQAFQDGIYLVIIDGEQQKELDREVYLGPDSRITFIRLVMLAGG